MEQSKVQIATCPMVENGVLGVLNLPGYSQHGPAGFEAVSRKLQENCADVDRQFWPGTVSPLSQDTVN